MSPSPPDTSDPNAVRQYATAWRAVLEMVRRGSSWSGRERNCVMLNCGGSGGNKVRPFADVSVISGLDFADDGRAVAVVDWDQDGDLDLWFRNRTAPRLRLMLNNKNKKQADDFITFRLQAVRGNRDAIGARVEIHLKEQPVMVQTLAAGDGFLSQSSKWLHFGLGDNAQIDRVAVRWPTGETDTFSGVHPGGRYHLKQGNARATEWNRPAVPSGLSAMVQQAAPESALAAIALPAKVPLPLIEYTDELGNASEVTTNGRPKLLVFWAEWCPSCIGELNSLGKNAGRLNALKLDVLALEVGGAGSSDKEPKTGKSLIEQLKYPFDHGTVSESSLEKIEHFQRALFENASQFAVPLSLLIDRRGLVTTIYQGPIDVELLLQDIRDLDANSTKRRDLALPYAGRWYTKPITPSAVAEMVGGRFTESYPIDAARYYRLAAEAADNDPRQLQLAATSLALYLHQARILANEGSSSKARRCFLGAVTVAPWSAEAHRDFGIFLMHQLDFDLAETHLLQAEKIAPDDTRIQQTLIRLQQLKEKGAG